MQNKDVFKSESRTLTYRVALFGDNIKHWTNSYDEDADYECVESSRQFIRWLTDEQTVEI